MLVTSSDKKQTSCLQFQQQPSRDLTMPGIQQHHRSDSPIPHVSERARDLSINDDKSLEELRCVLNKEPYQYALYKPCEFQALAALLVNCKWRSDSTFLLRFEPCAGPSSSGGTQHCTVASLMRPWAARQALEPGHAWKPRSSRLEVFDEDDFEILSNRLREYYHMPHYEINEPKGRLESCNKSNKEFLLRLRGEGGREGIQHRSMVQLYCEVQAKKKALPDELSALIRPKEHDQDEDDGMVQSAGLTTAVHIALYLSNGRRSNKNMSGRQQSRA
ncbi:hypothetical protein WJX77_011194 [Trebouxia sp. C0004]